MIKYFGNSAYCYSNSTAMLLSSIREEVSPSLIEVLSGVGVGAYQLKGTNIAFLSNYSGLPDQGITRALETLGFEFIESSEDKPESFDIDMFRKLIGKGPVLLGPLDMGYLKYNPSSNKDFGIDHFVLAHGMDDDNILVHDPAGFPFVKLDFENFEKTWKAESIRYRRGYYRYWARPKRVSSPLDKEMYEIIIKNLQNIYTTGDKYATKKSIKNDTEAIIWMANNVKDDKLLETDISMLSSFVLPLGSRRCFDFSIYFQKYDKELSDIKHEQSEIIGGCHTVLISKQYKKLTDLLLKLADKEAEFKQKILDK